MKIIYDAEVDILHLILSDQPVDESDEVKPGLDNRFDAHYMLL